MAVKRKYVPRREFLKAVMQGAKEGKTKAEVAKELGMQTDSFGTRLSTETTKLKDQGFHLPKLKSSTSRERLSDNEAADYARALMDELNAAPADESEGSDEVDDDGELSMESESETVQS